MTIPDNVTYIGYGAFYQCSNLSLLNIGKNVTTIEYAFQSCNLTEIHCKNPIPPILNGRQTGYGYTFAEEPEKLKETDPYFTATLYVPKGSLEAYKNAEEWGLFENIVEE